MIISVDSTLSVTHYRGNTIKNPPLLKKHPGKNWKWDRNIKRHPPKNLWRAKRAEKNSTFWAFYSAKTLKTQFSGGLDFRKNIKRHPPKFESQAEILRGTLQTFEIWPDLDLKGGVLNSITPVSTTVFMWSKVLWWMIRTGGRTVLYPTISDQVSIGRM